MEHELGDLPSSSHCYSTLHISRFLHPLGGQSRHPRPPPRGSRICCGLTWVSSGSKARAPVSTPRPAARLRPRCSERKKAPAGQTRRRNPFSPETVQSKSILLLLGNSSLYDSEATQLNRVSRMIVIKVLRPALPPSSPTFPQADTPGVTCAPLGRTRGAGRGLRPPPPRVWRRGSGKISKSPGSAWSRREAPAPNKPRQAQRRPRRGRARPGPPSCARHRGGSRVSTAPDPGSRRAPGARGAGTAST